VAALYVVATPIGNLEDISIRALNVLTKVKLIAAEDTRTTKHLLDTYNIKNNLTSYHEHNKLEKLAFLIDQLKKEDVAIVSEAGIPGLSDTGFELITEAIKNDITVIVIPGATALVTALIASGLSANQFTYMGFLPRRKVERIKLLNSIANENRTTVMYESPHRVLDSLSDIYSVFGDRRMAVCRELTKMHEEIFRGTAKEAIDHFGNPRGEFTLVIEGNKSIDIMDENNLTKGLRLLKKAGVSTSDAVKIVSELFEMPKKKVYSLSLSLFKGE
jgi:16S rRNA (cytidine1402-2'-O)-methyltransferase